MAGQLLYFGGEMHVFWPVPSSTLTLSPTLQGIPTPQGMASGRTEQILSQAS